MSSLNFCNLDQAFNNSEKSTDKKKKSKKKYKSNNYEEIDQHNPYHYMNKNQKNLSNNNDMDYYKSDNFNAHIINDKYSTNIDTNINYKKNNIDTNNYEIIQNNNEVLDILKNMQQEIINLTNELNIMKSNNNNKNKNIVEEFTNITFDNDNCYELLLYIFTGLLLLYLLDYLYKFGKKTF